MKAKFISGNEAAAEAVRLAKVQVVPAFPITPATTIPEKVAEIIAAGLLKAKIICVESEHSAMAATIGAAMSGVRVFTATSSQGLLLMNEMIFWAAGARLPIVMVNVNRAVCAPWALWAEHTDSLSVKDTGWMQFYCENAQEILDTILIAYRLSETLSIPSMVIYEGFLVSHAYESVEIPEEETVDKFLPPYKPVFKLDPENPKAYGGMFSQKPFSESRSLFHEDILLALREAPRLTKEYQEIVGHECEMIMETFNLEKAKTVIVAMGTMAKTIQEIISKKPEYGLIRLKMFRPFPKNILLEKINPQIVEKIVVFDRDISVGQGGQLWTEIRAALYGQEGKYYGPYCHKPEILNFITGLNGVDVTPEMIEKILKARISKESNPVVLWE